MSPGQGVPSGPGPAAATPPCPRPPGHTSPTQKEPTPFTIEWIPDILPRSRLGELRLKFQYGHHGGPRQPPPARGTPPSEPPPLPLPPLGTLTFP